MTRLVGEPGTSPGLDPAPALDPDPVDPDPTPTATPWEEYLAAAQSLDALRRAAAVEAAATTRAASTTRAELGRLSAELARQRARLAGEAARLGLPPPRLDPEPATQAAADALVAGDPAAVPEALHHCQRLLAEADTQLGVRRAPPGGRCWPPPPWLMIVAPLLAATGLACLTLLLLSLLP
jgi:hypothetical protein